MIRSNSIFVPTLKAWRLRLKESVSDHSLRRLVFSRGLRAARPTVSTSWPPSEMLASGLGLFDRPGSSLRKWLNRATFTVPLERVEVRKTASVSLAISELPVCSRECCTPACSRLTPSNRWRFHRQFSRWIGVMCQSILAHHTDPPTELAVE